MSKKNVKPLHPWLETPEGVHFANSCGVLVVKFRSPCVMPEHILLALLFPSEGKAMFPREYRTVREAICYQTTNYLQQLNLSKNICPEMTGPLAERFWSRVTDLQQKYDTDVHPTLLLLAILQESDSFAAYVLQENDVTEEAVEQALRQGLAFDFARAKSGGKAPVQASDAKECPQCLTSLTRIAREGGLDPLVGRLAEVESILRILNRKKKSAPLLVGPAGVGKTAVVEGIAWLAAQSELPPSMRNVEIYCLSTGMLMAGTSLQGDLEKRIQEVLAFIESEPHRILFLDELHNFMNAGANSKDNNSAGSLIKPEIAAGRLRCIGATTDDDYRKSIAPDHAFARRFHIVHIKEPSKEETLQILKGLEPTYAEYHGVHYSDQILQLIIDLTSRYLSERRLPDKAIDVMDEVGARHRLFRAVASSAEPDGKPSPWNPPPAGNGGGPAEITSDEIENAVCKMANLPSIPAASGDDDLSALADLEERLNSVVFGQQKAISLVSRAVKIAKCGLLPERAGTIGNFFFAGPSGVGKTEVARQLASILGVKLVRFDMSEYSTEQMVTRFVGSAPGLVGYEEGGQLTNAIRDTPHCVLLLDEIEKAHFSVHSLLLQIMDAGTLTDSRGFATDFHNVLLIMTGNVGCSEASAKSSRLGFGASSDTPIDPDIIEEHFKRAFSPEFRARLSATVIFAPLGMPEMQRIVAYKFTRLADLAAKRHFQLTLTEAARDDIARRAMEYNQGARPVDHILTDEITALLAERMVSKTTAIQRLTIDLKDGHIVLC
ncbi:MAG: AAA family ATPase [Victivallales bacterium]|nr:AAA family ATPase [Victivallales bacterium]